LPAGIEQLNHESSLEKVCAVLRVFKGASERAEIDFPSNEIPKPGVPTKHASV
jgi:hypothetical protein